MRFMLRFPMKLKSECPARHFEDIEKNKVKPSLAFPVNNHWLTCTMVAGAKPLKWVLLADEYAPIFSLYT